MEEVGCEVREEELVMFLASGPPENDLYGNVQGSVYSACFGSFVSAQKASAHRLINRPHGLRTAGLYSLGRHIGAKIWHSVHGSRRRSERGTCNNYYQ